MSSIQTYTGIQFDPLQPDTAQIRIEDIAHSLSMLCRANGHFKTFHSVAQHCINCMQEAAARGCSVRVQLACLLHDASEAYLSDITRPVKRELPGYLQIEKPLQEAIWRKWLGKLPDEQETAQVFQIDDAILAHEFLAQMGTRLFDPMPELVSAPNFSFTGFDRTEQDFLQHFHRLIAAKDP